MKTPLTLVFQVVVFALLTARQLPGQTLSTLCSFDGAGYGFYPRGGLILSSNTLYGTTKFGGATWGSGGTGWGYGTVFAINVDGTGLANLYNFTDGADGAHPDGGVVLVGNTLIGTAEYGGEAGLEWTSPGTLFSLNLDGTGFTTLYGFTNPIGGTNSDGAGPGNRLLQSSSYLYGSTIGGGAFGLGTLFRINVDGSGFTILHTFLPSEASGTMARSSSWSLSGDTLYGWSDGGSPGKGVVFAISTDGSGFRSLHTFAGTDGEAIAGLCLAGTTLYGVTHAGGTDGNGVVFALNTDGTGYRILHNFGLLGAILSGQGGVGTNADGAYPDGDLVISGDTLYGAATSGGSIGNGAIFALKTDGSGFTVLHNFSAHTPTPCPCMNVDGSGPRGPLVVSGGVIYGTTSGGGTAGYGTVFSIALPVNPPTLSLSMVQGNVILTWATNASGFTLQSTGDLNAWTNTLFSPVVINGLNTVTNQMSQAHQFYRLSQ